MALGLHRFGIEDLNPSEEIIYRANLFILAYFRRSILGWTLLGLGFLALGVAYIFRENIGFLTDSTITSGIVISTALLFLPGLYQTFSKLIDFLYDEDIITNQRVIDYNQKFFFSHEQSTAHHRTIENVNLIQDGIFRSLFDYGTLQVQTAASGSFTTPGQQPRFLLLDDVKHPRNVQRLIDELAHRVKGGHPINTRELLQMCALPAPKGATKSPQAISSSVSTPRSLDEKQPTTAVESAASSAVTAPDH